MFIWTIADVVGVVLGAILLVGIIFAGVFEYLKVRGCKHDKYFENGACQAICKNCRKDLGFIGTVRDARRGDE